MSEVKTYQQADEPTDITPGTTWLRADGTKAQRDLSGAWVEKGSWTLEDDGMLPASGGAATGAVTGNHGHAPTDSPAFTTIITLDDEEVPDKPWVTEQMTNMQTDLQNFITEALSGGESGISLGNNLAIGIGTVAHGAVIPLPKFADDTRATIDQMWGTPFLSIHDCQWGSGEHDTTLVLEAFADPVTLVATARTRVVAGGGSYTRAYDGTANYLIICKR